MTAVLDANIWISALLFGGTPGKALLKAYERGRIAICEEIAAEVVEVADRKFSQRAAVVKARLDALLVDALWVAVQGEVHVVRDPDDDMVLECARNGKAEFIVSGDRDLLELREFEGIPIVTAAQFVAMP